MLSTGKMVSVVFLTITILTFIRPFLLSLLFIFGPFFREKKAHAKAPQQNVTLQSIKHFGHPSHIQNAICMLSSISVRFRSSSITTMNLFNLLTICFSFHSMLMICHSQSFIRMFFFLFLLLSIAVSFACLFKYLNIVPFIFHSVDSELL